MEKIKSLKNLDLLNIFFFTYILSYIAGPAIINIYLTIISIYCLFYFYQNKVKLIILLKDKTFIFFSIFILYIFLKDIFFYKLNPELISFIRIYIIFSFICIYSLINIKKIDIKFKYIVLILFILNFDSIFQYIFKYNIVGYQIFNQYRLTSFFENEPIVGSFIMKLFFPLLIFYLSKIKKDLLTFVVLFLSIVVIFISGERMPFLQLIFGILILILFSYRFSIKIFLFFVALIFLIISIFIISPSAFDRYADTYKGLNSLYNDIKEEKILKSQVISRHGIYDYYQNFNSAIILWKKNHILGNGYRYYKNNCKNELKKVNTWGCSTHPHNIYLEILSDYGLVGLLIYLIFLYSLFAGFLKSNSYRKYYGIFLTVLVTSVPFVTSQSIFSSYYGSIYFFYIFLLRYYSVLK